MQLSQPLAPTLNFAQLRLSRADSPLHLAPVRKKARVDVPITSGSVVTSSYGGYLVANSTRNSSITEPTPPRAANCCIVACRGPQMQSFQYSPDELLVKKISARDSSKTLVAPPTAKSEIAYSMHYCHFLSFERCAVKRFRTYRTVALALYVLATKLLPCNITAPVHESCAKPLTTDVICTRDSGASQAAPRI